MMKSCTGCDKLNSKDCGKIIIDKGNNSIRYIKAQDDRCSKQNK